MPPDFPSYLLLGTPCWRAETLTAVLRMWQGCGLPSSQLGIGPRWRALNQGLSEERKLLVLDLKPMTWYPPWLLVTWIRSGIGTGLTTMRGKEMCLESSEKGAFPSFCGRYLEGCPLPVSLNKEASCSLGRYLWLWESWRLKEMGYFLL